MANLTLTMIVDKIRILGARDNDPDEQIQAAGMAVAVLNETSPGHPLTKQLQDAIGSQDWTRVVGACGAFLEVWDRKLLPSPTLKIAHQIEGGLLDIADAQVKLAERASGTDQQVSRAVAAFLAGAALEDGLRRLCDAAALSYDAGHTTIAKLQGLLYQPSKNIEIISSSENKQITSWGDTRNLADHGHFQKISQTDVVMMVIGVRSFLDKHLP